MVVPIPPKAEVSSVALTNLTILSNHQLCGSTYPVSAIEPRRLRKLETLRKSRKRNKLSSSLSFQSRSSNRSFAQGAVLEEN